MLLQVIWIAQGLLLCFTLISDCHRLPTVLTVGQYLANDLYKNFVLIFNRALPARHAYSGWQKASQGETAQPRRRAIKRTKCYVLRNAPVTMLVERGRYLAQSRWCLWWVWSKRPESINISFRSKFYSGCPDTPHKYYFILYLDPILTGFIPV